MVLVASHARTALPALTITTVIRHSVSIPDVSASLSHAMSSDGKVLLAVIHFLCERLIHSLLGTCDAVGACFAS